MATASAIRTSDDLARMFAERQSTAHVLWLTAKQAQWLADTYRRENCRRRNYDARETPAGQFCPECESVYTTRPASKGGAVRMQISPCQHRPVGCGDPSCCHCRPDGSAVSVEAGVAAAKAAWLAKYGGIE